ncbi:hypothetical protein [Microbacterium sp. NPDC087589]|uniref:hypothetical protein n=1 Tax=Microbacterium sp. NPDC087589 TaxID=3364191 RepID=UPI00381D2AB5
MTTSTTAIKPRLTNLTRVLLVIVPATLLGVSAFAMGTMQGDLRPAASEVEIERWNFATAAQTIAFGVFALALVLSVVDSFRWPRDSRMRRAATTILLVILVGAAVFIAAWMVGLRYFVIPTTN